VASPIQVPDLLPQWKASPPLQLNISARDIALTIPCEPLNVFVEITSITVSHPDMYVYFTLLFIIFFRLCFPQAGEVIPENVFLLSNRLAMERIKIDIGHIGVGLSHPQADWIWGPNVSHLVCSSLFVQYFHATDQ
jgi:hypothetical protein